ncbi:MAG: hypothetical protein HWQ23_04855 [Nostoc sp. JL33]|nr:hypothetical protein [Nostoc sp. JL33]
MKEKNVGWVEQSEPNKTKDFLCWLTLWDLATSLKRHLLACRQSRPTPWLPNLPRNLYPLSTFLAQAVMLG